MRSSKNFSFAKCLSWLQLIFLSLLPGLIFLWDWNPEGEKNYRDRLARLEWFNSAEMTADRFSQSSSIEFWQQIVAERFNQVFKTQLDANKKPREAIKYAWNASRPKHFPNASLHFFWRENSEWKIFSQGEMKTISAYLLRKLFQEMVLAAEKKANALKTATWEQRLKILFGHMIFPEQFSSDLRARPFSALIKNAPFRVIWDFLRVSDQSEIVGGYFMYFPDRFDAQQLPAKLIMENWSKVRRKKGVYPVLLPVIEGADNFFVHRKIDSPAFRKALLDFHRRHVKTVAGNVPGQDEKSRLPGEKMGAAFVLEDKWVRLCSLSPICGYMGMLVTPLPETQLTMRQLIARAYFLIAAIVWLLFLLRILIFRELPMIDLRLRVMAWFLAFAAFPAGLTIGAWSSLIQDFAAYRIDQLQKGLHDSMQNVEAEFSLVENRFAGVFAQFFNKPEFEKYIVGLPAGNSSEKEFFIRLFAHFAREDIKLSGVITLVQGGWYFRRFEGDALGSGKNAQVDAVASVMDQYLLRCDRNFYLQMKMPEDVSFNRYKVPAILNIGDLDVSDNFSTISDSFDKTSFLMSNRRNFLQYMKPINVDGKIFAVMILYWDLTDQFKPAFKNSMHQEGMRFRRKWGMFPDMAVYRVASVKNELIVKTGNENGLAEIADLPVSRASFFSDGANAILTMPSAKFSSMRYVARVTTANISLLVAEEQGFIIFSVTLLLLIIVLGASWASIWISGPLRVFVDRMKRLNSGQPAEELDLNRDDELGLAARSLRSMTNWVLERERLVKFISPKVLQLIAGGNVFKAGAGTIQEVTVLVSDIRSFTSISEKFPPEQVFSMVNDHLRQMAKIVRENSGMVDRFVGDAIWAVFFSSTEEGGKNALSAALAMLSAHRNMQEQRQCQGEFAYRIGIGIYQGKVLAGVIGDTSVRLDFSVVGEALQQAEFLEGLARNASDTGIIFSQSLKSCADELELRYKEIPDSQACEVIEA